MIALHFWIDPEPDPFDPTRWEKEDVCRIYDSDGERFAIVDQKYYSALISVPNPKPPGRKVSNYRRYGKISPRLWNIKPLHPNRNGKKLYFVSNAGWRKNGKGIFLHVEVMRLAGKKPPTPKHKIVNHKDGDEWNCTEGNLEWATHVKNRRMSKQKYIAASEMKHNER